MEEIFTTLTMAMTGRFGIAIAASFAWGILSILLSPCHLSSIPLIVGYISKQGGMNTKRSFAISLLFALGILATIALIGLVTASLGRMLGDVGPWGNLAVAGVFLAVGLYLLDLLRFSWNTIPMHPLKGRPWMGALTLGLLFGIGLGPCTFAYLAPVLGVVFSVGSTDIVNAVALIGAFGVGHCSVIVGAGSLAHVVQRYLNWSEESRGATWLRRLAGVCVLVGGLYFVYTAF